MSYQRVIFSGRVQGVGFRYSTGVIAKGFKIAGYVCNQNDGTVEVVVDGEGPEVDRFIGEIQEKMGSLIKDVRISRIEKEEHFTGFNIRY